MHTLFYFFCFCFCLSARDVMTFRSMNSDLLMPMHSFCVSPTDCAIIYLSEPARSTSSSLLLITWSGLSSDMLSTWSVRMQCDLLEAMFSL